MILAVDLYLIDYMVLDKIIIAIDGYASCGKSTTARLVAQRLNYTYIDSGAMYRAVTLYFLQNNISVDSSVEQICEALNDLNIEFRPGDDHQKSDTYLNDVNVEQAIRTPDISAMVSQVSALRPVREEMVRQQKRMGMQKGIVMDGRDIGTVVFPGAELKVFMTAGLEARANRRKQELAGKGIDVSLDEVENNLQQRDYIDSTREFSPLKQAADAIVIDTTDLSIEQQVERVCELANNRIRELS